MPQARLRLVVVVAAVFILAAWLVFSRPSGSAVLAPTPTFPPAPHVTITPPSLDELVLRYPSLERLLRDPETDSVYKEFVIAYEQGGLVAAEELARRRGLLTPDNEVRVTLVVDTTDTARLIDDLEALGVNVLGIYRDLIDISIPLNVIAGVAQSENPAAIFEQIRDVEHVVGLRLNPPSVPQSTHGFPTDYTELQQSSGLSIVSEGLFAINAAEWHAAGFTGQGIQIGVLDQGFDGFRDQLGRELPEQVSARSFVSGVEPDATGENHGTAVAEIVHDVAPRAELFFAHYDGGDVSMGNAVDWLLEQGVQIISHSAGGLAGPMDGTGRDAELVDRVTAQGVLWINSAGNSADEHVRTTYSDADGDGFHDFKPESSLLAFRPVPDQTTQIVLNWDDWPQADEDYDLYLLDRDGVVLASSRNIQTGNRAPVEQILYRFDDAGAYYISVQANDTSRPARLDLYIHEARSMEFTTSSHSLATPADARGALTVGAVDFRDNTLQPYSSYGPTEDGRQKPELLGPDGVSVATYAPEAFFGTSAAAPHVAGAAALIWSAHPGFDADDLRISLLASTIPVRSDAGVDATGSGVLRLPAPPRGVTRAEPATRFAENAPSGVAPAAGPTGAIAAVCAAGVGALAVISWLALRRRPAFRKQGQPFGSLRAGSVAEQNTVDCMTCGAQVPSTAQFCTQCGRPIDLAASRTCTRCGARLRPRAMYCSNCGAEASIP
jgi:subtilisin family serine protease/ribosomal protein L40E